MVFPFLINPAFLSKISLSYVDAYKSPCASFHALFPATCGGVGFSYAAVHNAPVARCTCIGTYSVSNDLLIVFVTSSNPDLLYQ